MGEQPPAGGARHAPPTLRRRIVRTTVLVTGATLLIVAVFVVSTAVVRISDYESRLARAEADRVAAGLSQSLTPTGGLRDELDARDEAFSGFLLPDSRVEVRLPDGRVLTFGEPSSRQRVHARSSGYPVEVEVWADGTGVVTSVVRVGAGVLAIALLALVAAFVMSRRLADRLVTPIGELAAAAERLGRGDARPSGVRSGVPELDAVAEVLDQSATRIGEQLAAERRLASDVSHQLRTPLTALSMRLEEVIATDDAEVARAEATVALQQAERLSGVVDDLLGFARHTPAEQSDVDVDGVLDQQVTEWRKPFEAAGRRVRRTGATGLVARGSAGALSQVVATLLENALVHGAGAATVSTRRSGRWVVVEVSDEGPGVPLDLVRRIFEREFSGASRTGLGLAVARALVEVDGGRLELTRRTPPTFTVFLAPAARVTDAGRGADLGGQPDEA